jgi:hypothetical protein
MNYNKNLFILEDYKQLNKDLGFTNDSEYLDHYNNIGKLEMRLCNKNQLNVINEFGNEMILYISYFHYLYLNNLLFDNKITTYVGMKPYYFFLPDDQIIEKNQGRIWMHPHKNWLPTNCSDFVFKFDKKYWNPPNYKEYYKNNYFNSYDKPLLIINNKYNVEWSIKPFNFFSIESLDILFTKLQDKYTIIYMRPHSDIKKDLKYSWDDNTCLDYDDFKLIKEKYSDTIIFDDLFNDDRFKDMSYNLLKCYVLASCDNYISVQGGGAYLISYFAKKLVIIHKRGEEICKDSYNGWFKETCPSNNLDISVAFTEDQLYKFTDEKFIECSDNLV